jgi:NAD(P)-dependent dehydrogenase (short-subunit alcohol dehydrogenase family)
VQTDGLFDGQVLLVTGGGSGIGAATARMFAERGGQVAVIDIHKDAAEDVAGGIPGAVALAVDVSDEAAVAAAVATAEQHFGRIDCLLNSAGHAIAKPLREWSYGEFTRMLAVHVGGMFLTCRETVPIIKRGGGGAIVNMTSIAALIAQPTNGPYGAAKGAILAFTRQLALELAPEIRVNAIAPGRTRTPMTEQIIIDRGDGDLERGLKVTLNLTPMHHICEAWEIAEAICFLLSRKAPFITAQTLVIDGGETAT